MFDFVLEDTDGRRRRLAEFRGCLVVLVVAGKDSGEAAARFGAALGPRLGEAETEASQQGRRSRPWHAGCRRSEPGCGRGAMPGGEGTERGRVKHAPETCSGDDAPVIRWRERYEAYATVRLHPH